MPETQRAPIKTTARGEADTGNPYQSALIGLPEPAGVETKRRTPWWIGLLLGFAFYWLAIFTWLTMWMQWSPRWLRQALEFVLAPLHHLLGVTRGAAPGWLSDLAHSVPVTVTIGMTIWGCVGCVLVRLLCEFGLALIAVGQRRNR